MSRRVKIFHVDCHLLTEVFNGLARHEIVSFPEVEPIPHGALVEEVFYDHHRRCFCAIVSHESFPEVPDGELIPHEPDVFLNQTLFRRRRVQETHVAVGTPEERIAQLEGELAGATRCIQEARRALGEHAVDGEPLAQSITRLVSQTAPRSVRAGDEFPSYPWHHMVALHSAKAEELVTAVKAETIGAGEKIGVAQDCDAKADLDRADNLLALCGGEPAWQVRAPRDVEAGGEFYSYTGHHMVALYSAKAGEMVMAVKAETIGAGEKIEVAPDYYVAALPAGQAESRAIQYTKLATSPQPPASVALVCPDCKGTGQYVGLNAVEPCARCAGSGAP